MRVSEAAIFGQWEGKILGVYFVRFMNDPGQVLRPNL